MLESTYTTSIKPNFFILGAPKCGTTSLAEWFGEHHSIFISNPKEPKFFNTDWHLPNRPHSLEEYERLFLEAKKYSVAGEATTGYLSSRVAVSKILDYNPNAKFLVCLRDPINMFASLHAQRLKEGVETERDLSVAWNKQFYREKGYQIPSACTDSKTLLYGPICSLGEQVERLLKQVSRNQVHFVMLEDLKDNPLKEYRLILEFLNVEDDGRTNFPVKNVGRRPRILWIAQSGRVLGRFKKKLGIYQNFGIQRWFNRRNEVPRKKQNISSELYVELINYFKDDVAKLSTCLEKDLNHWLTYDAL